MNLSVKSRVTIQLYFDAGFHIGFLKREGNHQQTAILAARIQDSVFLMQIGRPSLITPLEKIPANLCLATDVLTWIVIAQFLE